MKHEYRLTREDSSMTSHRNIGGPIDWATLYGRDQHRPTDGENMQAECRRLRDSGLMVHDIAVTLRIGVAAVHQALREVA
jgi:hypothetical protein